VVEGTLTGTFQRSMQAGYLTVSVEGLEFGDYETANNAHVTTTGFEEYGKAVRRDSQGLIEGLC
jgi:hypothetical protein